MSDNDSEKRVLSGQSWNDFCDRLKAAGAEILRPEAPATALDRAEGWRYLSRLARVALEMNLECADPDFPEFYQASNTTIKIGADNPDNNYYNATICGDRDYVISGIRGSATYLGFGTKANRYAIDGTMASTGELDAKDLEIEPDGSFEIIVSPNKHPGNWLPTAPDSTMVIVRETFLDREEEEPAILTIDRLDGPDVPQPLTPEFLDRGLMNAAAFVHGTARTFADWSKMFSETPNRFYEIDQSFSQRAGGDPSIFYLHGYWKLAADEALVIDSRVPECFFWNFQLDNWWMESLDYRYRPIWVNKEAARYNKDSTVTIVVAARDVGVGNWIDTAGHTNGTMLLRWQGAKDHPMPTTRVVKLAELSR